MLGLGDHPWPQASREPLLGHAAPGLLGIHAGLQIDRESQAILESIGCEVPGGLTTGALIGVVDLVDIVRYRPGERRLAGIDDSYGLADDPLATGPFCWILRNPRALDKPILLSGQRGLFDVDLT